ncbi:hypothetical protein HUJ04_003094 [Dendroctonus ponderosae]
MKLLVVLSYFICVAFASLSQDSEKWLKFKNQHNKVYETVYEEKLRFAIFQENVQIIEEQNRLYEAGEATYRMAVNKFTDLSREEYLSILKHQSSSRPQLKAKIHRPSLEKPDLPNATDWRNEGAVTRVKDQGSCGSCWAFSVTGTLESFDYLRHKEKGLVEFSEQQLLDCDLVNDACNGGEEAPAMEYFVNYGIEREDAYPYVGARGTCQYNESAVYAKLENYIQIEPGDEETLLTVVGFLGPTSVALEASGLAFYSQGIYTSSQCSQTTTNHAVLAVGYDVDEETGLDYWIIKNSWGADWGEDGYFRIRRGENECAIAMDSVYPSFGIE